MPPGTPFIGLCLEPGWHALELKPHPIYRNNSASSQMQVSPSKSNLGSRQSKEYSHVNSAKKNINEVSCPVLSGLVLDNLV